MKVKNQRKRGFTLVEIMIVVAIIGLLAAIAIPNFIHARQTSQTNACIENLRQIDAGKQQWALEAGKVTGATVGATDIAPYVGRNGSATDVYCPLVGSGTAFNGYTIQNIGTTPTCNQTDPATHNAVLQ